MGCKYDYIKKIKKCLKTNFRSKAALLRADSDFIPKLYALLFSV